MRKLISPLPLLLVAVLFAVAGRAQQPSPLTTGREVRGLSREAASRRLPVVARGVVTLLPLPPSSFTLDDGTGVWVELHGPHGEDVDRPANLRVGDVVEVRGVTHEGLFVPLISATDVRIVGRGEPPAPQAIDTVGLNSSKYGSQRVRLDGVVQSAEAFVVNGHDEFRLALATEMGHFDFVLLGRSPLPPDALVDAEVALTGVALCEHNNRRQFTGLRIWSNNPSDIRITRPARGPLEAPEIDLRDVMTFSPYGTNLHRRRVRGVVALGNPGQYLYIENSGQALRINAKQPDVVRPGDVVEAAGFFQMDNFRAEMTHAVFRVVGHQAPPAPVTISPEEAFRFSPGTAYAHSRDVEDRLVTFRGRLVGVEHLAGAPRVLTLETRGHFFVAEFASNNAGGAAALRPGSVLDVTGILAITYANPPDAIDWQRPTAVRMLLRDPADIRVIRSAPWWTTGRLQAALGIVVAVLALALAWSVLLRRRVAQRGEQLAAAIRAKRDAQVEFESTLRERNRLAADLHDTMEQALTGLALQLEVSDALQAQSAPASHRHLAMARQLLARSREDLRRSIWNLRSSALEQQTLLQALRALAVDRGVGQRTRIEVVSEGGDRPLPEWLGGNLLLLAQECITNALKHADASVIRITLGFAPGELTLEIRDDGRGFDPAAAAGARDGHFGVQGMRERMKRLGGTLVIESSPGAGTRVIASVPIEERMRKLEPVA